MKRSQSRKGVAGQVPVSDITGVVGVLNDGSTVTAVKTCEQDSTQANGDWYRLGADGVTSQLPVGDLAVILGLVGNSGNGTDVLKTCDQGASQNK